MRIKVKEEFHLIFFAMLIMFAEALTFIQLYQVTIHQHW